MERRLLAAAASPAARARTRFLLRFVATWGAITALAVLVVGRSAATAVADYEVVRLETQVASLTAVHRGLEAQVEALRAAPRLAAAAAASGLVLPQTLRVLPIPTPAAAHGARPPRRSAPKPWWHRWLAAVRAALGSLP
ncbi:MAG: hypothetical protein K6V73_11670 [Firmicutes bacterium]|nr:hypothetical protein [Bacillota bacterium]